MSMNVTGWSLSCLLMAAVEAGEEQRPSSLAQLRVQPSPLTLMIDFDNTLI